MPTYEYECAECSYKFEVFQSITEAQKRKCPKCKKPKLKRLIGKGSGIIFKGSGFYQTDYKNPSYSKQRASEDKSGNGSSNAAKSKKDVKSESAKSAD